MGLNTSAKLKGVSFIDLERETKIEFSRASFLPEQI
jgi:hypothetical protein